MTPEELLSKLIAIDSQNPGAYELEIVDFIKSLFTDKSVRMEVIMKDPSRPNLIIRKMAKDKNAETLVFNGHLDTKPSGIGWTSTPHSPVITDGKIFGLGACDMKGGLTGMIWGLLNIIKNDIPHSRHIELQLVADEEMNSEYGTRYLIEKEKICKNPVLSIICEPSSNQLVVKSVGNHWFEFHLQGKKGHAGKYWLGISAPQLAVNFISELQSFAHELRGHSDDFNSKFPNINIGGMLCEGHPGNVNDSISFQLDLRFKSNEENDLLLEKTEQLIKEIEFQGASIEMKEFAGGRMPAWSIHESNSGLQDLKLAMEDITGQGAVPSVFYGGSDAGLLSYYAHQPVAILGPGSLDQAHKPDEFVLIEELQDFSKICLKFMSV